MPKLLATICHKRGFIQRESFAAMTSNVNFATRQILLQFFINSIVCDQSVAQQNYKNSSVCKFAFEVISWN